MKVIKTKDGKYKIIKKWSTSGCESAIIVTKEEIADLVDLLVDIQNKQPYNKKTAPIAFGIGDHPDFKYED